MPSVAMAATQSAGEKKKVKKESPEVEADCTEKMKQDKKIKRKVKLEIKPDVGDSDIAVAKKRKEKKRKAVEVERDDGETSSESGEPVNDVGKKKNKMNSKEDNDEIEEKEADPNAVVNFRISKPLRDVLKDKGIESLFPIQARTFNVVLDGADLVGRARTGQGKTLAFVLPILESLTNGPAKASRKTVYGKGDKKAHPSVLVLLPTRELATQVCSDFEVYGGALGLKSCCLYGGQPMSPQVYALRNGVDIVVGTPGRVKDHLERGNIDFGSLCFRVLDEADEMMRMGFVEDVELILGMNGTGKVAESETKTVQTLLFSATLPSWINKLSAKFLKSDKEVVDLVGNEKMKASNSVTHYVLPCSVSARTQVIPDIIRCYSSGGRTIIFTETKDSASTLSGVLPGARALHGDIQQATREVTLSGFRSGKFQTLVATNVAARGLDIDDVQLIIQCEPPRDVEAYIHRSGRTGRAGKSGVAVMLYDPRKSNFTRIERESGVKFIQISAPQPADIAKTLGAQAAEKINEMSDSIIPVFRAAAEELLSSSDLSATDMLAKALAKAADYTEIKTRSLLTSMENFVTVLLVCGRPIYSPSFAYNVLRRFLPEDKVESIKGLALTADGQGAVFDVAAEDLDTFLAGQQNAAGVQLEVVKTLPQLQEREPLSRGGRFGGGRGGGYRRDGGGRFSGGRGGGRGNNRRW